MTFLLQKFNAINRSRTEVRVRKGLRPTASGIAFTGRLAVVCLLLAGFLGVGSAIAQPHVLRMGDGSISVVILDNEVHHYLIDTDGDGDYSDETLSAAGTDPTGRGGTNVNTFLVGGIALVTWDGAANPNTLMVTPVSTGGFKVATSPDGDMALTTAAGSNNIGTPYEFVVLSAHAPRLIGAAGFMDPDVADAGRGGNDAIGLTYEVTINDASAAKVGSDTEFTWVTSYMTAEVTIAENTDANRPGHTGASVEIRPRSPGAATFTVTATDMGARCRDTFTFVEAMEDATYAPAKEDRCGRVVQGTEGQPGYVAADTTGTFPDAKSVKDAITVTIVTKTSPKADKAIPNRTEKPGGDDDLLDDAVVADGDAVMFDLEDLNGAADGKPAAFADPTKEGPAGPAVQAVLAAGFKLATGAEALVVNLRNLTNLPEKDASKHVSLFIDPNANKDDSLPGGLLYKMQIKDVEALHRYDDLSSENDVYTSAMRITLDPAAATLTVMPTGANYPNPFNPQTTIDYALPQAGDVSLVVYDMLGREVDVLLDGPQAAGRHTVRFGANHLPNGAYVYRLVAADKTITRTMVLVK